jgi:molecular chaperone Hsp33
MDSPPVPDEVARAASLNGYVSVRALAATGLTREAAARHRTAPAATVALARALMGGVLLGTESQDGERLQIRFKGDGPLGTILVTAESDGSVRGYVQHPDADADLVGDNLGVARAIGFGSLSVDRNHPSWKQPYTGIVPIVDGEIAQDLARYLLESEQKPSAVALSVWLSGGGEIEAAGGYLIQSLPGASDDVLRGFESRVAEVHPAELLRGGADAAELLGELLGAAPTGEVERRPVRFHCPCNRDRVRRAATLLGREELREMSDAGEDVEVRCAFCAETYRLNPDAVRTLLPDA